MVAEASLARSDSWARAVDNALQGVGISLPYPLPDAQSRRSHIHNQVRPFILADDVHRWRAQLSSASDPGLQLYASCIQTPEIPAAHRSHCTPRQAAAWCRLRHGGSTLPSHRGVRHRGARGCHLCGSETADFEHALCVCPALASARERWQRRAQPYVMPWKTSGCVRWFCHGNADPHLAAVHAQFAYAIECAFAHAHNAP